MSDEKKIKELLARLVAMSPEPPPFPEEVTMVRQQDNRVRRPALVFVGAAALVAALAVPVVLLTREGPPLGVGSTTSTTTLDASTSTNPDPETSTTSTPTTLVEGSRWQGVVYLVAEPINSFLGNPALVPIRVEVEADPGTFGDHVEFSRALAAIDGMGASLPEGLENLIPADVIVLSPSLEGDLITADMSGAFLSGAGGLLADLTMLNQLIYGLTEMYDMPGASVLFTVNAEEVVAYGTDGIDLTEPVGREDFIDHLNPIFLTEPITAVEHVYVVAGMANTFEASLMVAVVDANGDVIHEEPVQASCGSGCWGEFGVGVASDLIVPGESSIRLFTYSAEDGSVTDAITIPIAGDEGWQISAG